MSERQDWFGRTFTAPDLLNHIFGDTPPGVYFELTYILPPELAERGPSPITESYRLGYERPDWAHITDLNTQGYGVYYGLTSKQKRTPAGRRSKETDTAYCSVLWVDVDLDTGTYANFDQAHHALCYMRPVPTAIVLSGGGIHALWCIAPVEITPDTAPIIKQTLRGLALETRGDPHVAELARVFRLPDTINTKPKRQGAKCIVDDILRFRYTLADFEYYRLLVAPIHAENVTRIYTAHRPDNLPQYAVWYAETSHAEGNRNSTLNWAAYKMHSDGYSQLDAETILLPRALTDGLPEVEARRTIVSAFAADQGEPSYLSKRARVRMAAGNAVHRLISGAGKSD